MTIRISSIAIEAMRTAAATDRAHEVCGLLFGEDGIVTDARQCANVADDRARRFEIDPAALFAAQRAERSGGARLIGYFHSHPNGRATPSATDHAQAARDGRIWAIVAAGRVTLWQATASGLHATAFAIDD